jgi:hypothetical protein
MDEVRTRIIYDYGRWDFEQELLDYLGEDHPLPTDEEWVAIQESLQLSLNESAWGIIRTAMVDYKNKKENK